MSAAPPHGRGAWRSGAGEHRVALFGGTFDPIHAGHLAVARAAQHLFRLDQIHFIPTSRPPHRPCAGLAPFADRYAMVALACADHPRFLASLAESPDGRSARQAFYSVDTVTRFKRKFHGLRTHLYFLLGADSFLQISTWKNYRKLLNLCDFVVANRPGFALDALRRVIPPEMLVRSGGAAPGRPGAIALRRTTIYVLDTVSSSVSATQVRGLLGRGDSIHRLVPPLVEEYITKQALYR